MKVFFRSLSIPVLPYLPFIHQLGLLTLIQAAGIKLKWYFSKIMPLAADLMNNLSPNLR